MKKYFNKEAFTEILEINDLNIICIKQEVRDRCADNYCGFYGKNYMCPPIVGDLEYYRKLIKRYHKGLIFSNAYMVKNRYDYQGMLEAGVIFREKIQEIDQIAKKDKSDCLFFSAGTCSICKTCGILTNEACRFPEHAIPSLEAAGIDVVQLCRDLGMRYNNGADKVTYFGLVLYENNESV